MGIIEDLGLKDEIIELYNKGLTIRQVKEELDKNHIGEELPSETTIFRFLTKQKPQVKLTDIDLETAKNMSTKIESTIARGYSDITGNSINSRQTTKFRNKYLKEIQEDVQLLVDRVVQQNQDMMDFRGEFIYNFQVEVINPLFLPLKDCDQETISKLRDRFLELLKAFLESN